MAIMKTILVPTDFSDCANYASETAIELAKKTRSEIHFYHFMSIPVDWLHLSGPDAEKMYPEVSRQVRFIKNQLAERVKMAEAKGIVAKPFIGYNESVEDIIRYAADQRVNMIVMGSHGSKGLKEFFIGSNAQKIVRQSRVPVFIVKHPLASIKFDNILFVSNFEAEMLQPFEHVIALADLLGAKVNLLYINTPAAFVETWEVRQKMETFIALAGSKLHKAETIDTRFFEEGIEKYCEENNDGLLTIATHHTSGMSRFFLGGLAEKVVNHVKIPVMSIPIREWSGYPRL